jgi:hypothetical protein
MLMRIARTWIPLAFVVTVLCGFTYAGIQQVYRNSADDPQIQMAEDAAAAIGAGATPASAAGTGAVDADTSLAPFVIVYSAARRPVAGTGRLGGVLPTPPPGVFDAATAMGRDRFTWQPPSGVRIATVVIPVEGGRGWVLAGRSLREAERRVDQLGWMALAAWAVALAGSLALVGAFEGVAARHRPRRPPDTA